MYPDDEKGKLIIGGKECAFIRDVKVEYDRQAVDTAEIKKKVEGLKTLFGSKEGMSASFTIDGNAEQNKEFFEWIKSKEEMLEQQKKEIEDALKGKDLKCFNCGKPLGKDALGIKTSKGVLLFCSRECCGPLLDSCNYVCSFECSRNNIGENR